MIAWRVDGKPVTLLLLFEAGTAPALSLPSAPTQQSRGVSHRGGSAEQVGQAVRSRVMEIEYMRTDALRAYAGNAKEHPPEQVDQIAESIRQFGFNDPIAVWGKDNTVVEGHGRLAAAKQIGITEVPVIRLDHLDDEQRRAYTLAHNQLTLNSGYDMDALRAELEAIDSIDMAAFDFSFADDDNEEDAERFSVDDIEVYRSYEREHDSREWFTSNFTFPAAEKEQITAYLQRNKARIIEEIIAAAREEARG